MCPSLSLGLLPVLEQGGSMGVVLTPTNTLACVYCPFLLKHAGADEHGFIIHVTLLLVTEQLQQEQLFPNPSLPMYLEEPSLWFGGM